MYHSRATGNNVLLYAIAVVGNINFVMSGVIMGWPQSVLPQLVSSDSTITLTYDEGAWVAGIMYAGLFLGGFIPMFIASRFGVKRTLLLGILPSLAGWIIIAIASTYWELLVGRFILGLMVGMSCDVTESYIAESSPAKIRGRLCASCSVSVHLGLLLTVSIEPYLAISETAGIYIATCILYFVVFILLADETPFWYARNGKYEKAKKSLQRLRRCKNVSVEYEEILRFVKKGSSFYIVDNDFWSRTKVIFSRIENRKAVLIVVLLTSGQQFSGIQAMNTYAELLFEKSVTIISGKYVAILMGLFELFFTVVGTILVDLFGRKFMFTFSGLISASLMGTMGVYFHLQAIGTNLEGWDYLPVACILLFAIFYSIGLSSVAAVVAGEVYSSEMRVTGMSIKTLFFCTSGLAVTKLWQVIASAAGDQYSFWTVSIITYLHVFVLYFIQPETKGKPLTDIQDELSGKSYRARSKPKETVYALRT